MNEERTENKGCLIKAILLVIIAVLIVLVLKAAGLIRWEETPNEVGQEEIELVTDNLKQDDFVVSETEWKALQREVRQLRKQLEQLLKDDASPIFVYDKEGVQAYLFAQIQDVRDARLLQDRKTLYIDDLCVDERMRGRGIGQQMFAFARNYAQSIGCDAITLNVWAGNSTAWDFYQHLGMHVQKATMEVRV